MKVKDCIHGRCLKAGQWPHGRCGRKDGYKTKQTPSRRPSTWPKCCHAHSVISITTSPRRMGSVGPVYWADQRWGHHISSSNNTFVVSFLHRLDQPSSTSLRSISWPSRISPSASWQRPPLSPPTVVVRPCWSYIVILILAAAGASVRWRTVVAIIRWRDVVVATLGRL